MEKSVTKVTKVVDTWSVTSLLRSTSMFLITANITAWACA